MRDIKPLARSSSSSPACTPKVNHAPILVECMLSTTLLNDSVVSRQRGPAAGAGSAR